MGNTEYTMSSLDEYFEILDKENKKRSELIAKSLVKYLQKNKQVNKFETNQLLIMTVFFEILFREMFGRLLWTKKYLFQQKDYKKSRID